jgi:hypothetical protein
VRRARISVVVVLLCCLCAAGCTTDGQAALITTGTPRASVAFEQIDGPPEGVFRKLVRELAQEAEVRRVAVLSRKDAAQFRVRGYVAMHVRGDRTTVAWVWDVYDADQKRALRISGEEDAGRAGGDAWATMDDRVLRRISRTSLDQLVAFLAAPPQEPRVAEMAQAQAPPPDAPAPEHVFTLAATSDEFAPEAYGIFRLPNAGGGTPDAEPTDATTRPPSAGIPLPRPRPADTLAYVTTH